MATTGSPIGKSTSEAGAFRAKRSQAYREARAEYARLEKLKEQHPIAAHLRERRLELELTQEQVAEKAGTSHSQISRLESGASLPKLETLQRIAAVLDEEIAVCFDQRENGELVERKVATIA